MVVAFFVCWAPFHAQRLMTIYIKDWTPELIEVQNIIFHISGKAVDVLHFYGTRCCFNRISVVINCRFNRSI